MNIAIVGGGIGGLALGLHLKARGFSPKIYEQAPEIKELGVGITILPHAARELSELGVLDAVKAEGIENRESAFYNRFGQLIYKEPRGKLAGYTFPEIGVHRGRLHAILYKAAVERLGGDAILTNHRITGLDQDEEGVSLHMAETTSGNTLPDIRADIVIGCDGVNSAVRRQFYPGNEIVFTGINTWRGVTRRKPILDGRTYFRIGSIRTAKIVIYPIADNIDGNGNQLINWTTEVQMDRREMNDWNKPGNLDDFLPFYKDWRFDWLDVPQLIRESDILFEYPMVDKDPIDRWTFGRVTFAGDAAHPMYPRGSNGSAQALIDVRVLADLLQTRSDPLAALKEYEATRTGPTGKVVRTNRENPPDFINIKVEELTDDKPFDNLDRFISQDELRALSDSYKKVAGFGLADVK